MPAGASLTRLGYDTRSRRNALVMRAVDALNPFKREREFEWAGRASSHRSRALAICLFISRSSPTW
jgi:hypothetical protein